MAILHILSLSFVYVCSFLAYEASAEELCTTGTTLRICDDNRIYLRCNEHRQYEIVECDKGYIFGGENCVETAAKRCGLPCDNKWREVCDNDDDHDGNVHEYYPFYYKCEPVDNINRYTLIYCPDGQVFREGLQQCRPNEECDSNDEDSDDSCSEVDEDTSSDDD